MIELLKSHKVIICVGSGGVGKTTLSASIALLAADSGLRTLVLTIDPAQRLAQSLGIRAHPGQIVQVPGVERLSALMIDARREFDEFVLGSVDSGIAKGLFKNRLYQQLVSNLNGNQEFTSLLRLLNAARSGDYDLVVLDTPPAQNAVDFLRASDRLYALFQDSVIGWFANRGGGDQGFIRRTLNRGTRMVTSALEALTGSVFIVELKDFFDHLSHLQSKVGDVSRAVGEVLHSPDTGFLLVTGYDSSKLREALEFQQDLKAEDLHLSGVILNRWFPEWAQGESDWPARWEKDPDFLRLKSFHAEFTQYFQHRREGFERFEQQLAKQLPVMKLMEFQQSVQGLEDLRRITELLREKWGDARA